MESNYPVDPKNLSEKGSKGVMSSIAGIGLLGVNAILGIPMIGTVISAGLLGLGAIGLFGKSKTDKVSGSVLGIAGIVGLSTLFLPGPAHSLLSLGGLGLLGYGIYHLFGFLRGIKNKK